MQTMPTREVDIYVDTNVDFIKVFPLEDSNEYTFYGKIQKHIDSCEPTVEFTLTPNRTDGITWDSFVATLTADQTALLKPDRSYIYVIAKRHVAGMGETSMVVTGNVLVSLGAYVPEPTNQA